MNKHLDFWKFWKKNIVEEMLKYNYSVRADTKKCFVIRFDSIHSKQFKLNGVLGQTTLTINYDNSIME